MAKRDDEDIRPARFGETTVPDYSTMREILDVLKPAPAEEQQEVPAEPESEPEPPRMFVEGKCGSCLYGEEYEWQRRRVNAAPQTFTSWRCRRYPPAVVARGECGTIGYFCPAIDPEQDWCGEWSRDWKRHVESDMYSYTFSGATPSYSSEDV